jgi:hypothetical protein
MKLSRPIGTFFVLSAFSSIEHVHASSVKLETLTPTKINKPAFLFSYEDGKTHDLLVASFAPFGADSVMRLTDPGNPDPEKRKISVLTTAITWPNEVKTIPPELKLNGWVSVAGGFLVPGKNQGAITLLNVKSGEVVPLTKSGNFFYHRVEWHDMNNDGRLDIVTARANKPVFGQTSAEMLWLEQPASPLKDKWTEHIMIEGPDVFFRGADLDKDGKMDFIATEFFGKKLSLIQQDAKSGKWTREILDDTVGAAFDLSFADLNNDGKTDLLVTNHEGQASKASVFGYEIPNRLKDQWVRHTLLTNIPTTQRGMNQASPGEAVAFAPTKKLTHQKPWIAIGGDGSQKLWLLEPSSEETSDWTYKVSTPIETKSTIGKIEVTDLDNDGNKEIHVPAYDDNLIYTIKIRD